MHLKDSLLALCAFLMIASCGDDGSPEADDAGPGEVFDADTSADAGPCTPASPAVEVCGNGIDEDCNALIDDPALCDSAALIDLIEDPSGAAWASADLFVHASPAAGVTGTLECRSGKVASDGSLSTNFAPCGTNRFSPGLSPAATGDGLYRTEFRIAHADGVNSEALQLPYYLHASLEGALRCELAVTEAALFTKALERLPVKISDTGPTLTFSTESAVTSAGFAQLANPFIRLNFTPRSSQAMGFGGLSIHPNFGRTDGLLKPLSLRRNFQFNADQSLVLITRRYAARRGDNPNASCQVMGIQRSTGSGPKQMDICDAIVLNREGAGVCLRISGSNISFLFNPPGGLFSSMASTMLGETPLTDLVDNAMWRKIGRIYSPVPGTLAERAACASSSCADQGWSGRWGSPNFSPKCYGAATCTSEVDALSLVDNTFTSIYLPDDGLFRFE